MAQYKNILVAVDLMHQSKAVFKKAIELAELFKSKLNTIHVIDPIPTSGMGFQAVDSMELEMELEVLNRSK